jgi:hypothetical protein
MIPIHYSLVVRWGETASYWHMIVWSALKFTSFYRSKKELIRRPVKAHTWLINIDHYFSGILPVYLFDNYSHYSHVVNIVDSVYQILIHPIPMLNALRYCMVWDISGP